MQKILIALALIILTNQYCPVLTGQKYQKQSAAEKFAISRGKCSATTQNAEWYSALQLAEIFIYDMNKSFDFEGDDVPSEAFVFRRKKLIHTVGVVAHVEFVSNNAHPYTGIFKGSKNAIIRASLAKVPANKANIVPGFALKFFRNGQKSANTFAMYSLNGQSSYNYFEHDFTNHVPDFGSDIAIAEKLLVAKFRTASVWETMMGLKDIASFEENGKKVDQVNFPFRLVFHPSKKAHELFKGIQPSDDQYFLNKHLNNVFIDNLYEVYAEPTPGAKIIRLGDINMKTSFKDSSYGDDTLFFQHSRMEEDFEIHPEWVQPAQDIVDEQKSSVNWTFKDLPWN